MLSVRSICGRPMGLKTRPSRRKRELTGPPNYVAVGARRSFRFCAQLRSRGLECNVGFYGRVHQRQHKEKTIGGR